MEKRRYELKQRAARVEETRRRIVEATVELHRTVGPAATQITEVARRADVQRVTVYNHFPDDASLIAACSAHWRGLHPAPDITAWAAVEDSRTRRRTALEQLYRWFRETEPMTANVLRDAETLPALDGILDRGLRAYLTAVRASLLNAFPSTRAGPAQRLEAAVRAVVDFHFWRSLSSLGDAEAAELAARFIETAARR